MSEYLPDLTAGLEYIESILKEELMPHAGVVRAGGAFDSGEMRRHVLSAPVVLLSLLGAGASQRHGRTGWIMSVQLAAYVLTRDTPPMAQRDDAALSLVTKVLRIVNRSPWSQSRTPAFGVVEQDSVSATNLYSGAIDSAAVALWAVTWSQNFILDLVAGGQE
jgi:hypothetical protein